MRWGKVEVTGGFLLVMAWLNYTDTQGLLPAALCAAFAHELGHWVAIRLLGGRVCRLRLSAVGAEMVLERSLSYGRECFCAFAGPVVNLLLAVCFSRGTGEWALVFTGLNLALALFNLLPLPALDGGRALLCVACLLLTDPGMAQRICRWVEGAALTLVCVLGGACMCWGGAITLPLCALWLLWSGGRMSEKRVVKVRRNG